MNEAEFIAALRTLPLHPGAEGLRDDTATLAIGGETLILTHDAIAEGVHYRAGTDPFDIAWKLVAVNLSDLAAKGAEPLGVLIGAVLVEGAERFVEGLRAILTEYAVPLLGGDTISVSPATFGCTAIGRAGATVPRRDGGRAGDALWVTGTIGAAMLGFEAGDGAAYLRPRPRLAEGRALAPHVHAMMDVSDGLLLDAARLAEASGCTAGIARAALPVAPGADPLRAATWGDDYELLFAAPADFAPPVPATRIGTLTERGSASLLLDGAAPDCALGYQHR
ncbi:MAG: thiamine-phosphate kinase [Sphingomonas sp.]|uniref:thiamine-phosphate kinase n=1 Tax=unclassified Sphingomonas TaxID=196159 RepID=UPI0024548999|nr:MULTISPECIES: thiamine-phosphate kinase [unclassified Sphingomonas]MBQ1498510.1 thiamine-phosphate kinase [Sphingomonas sp.]MDH4744287.1 thiamine-phosphate kinase [Sphingomonas sp. CBMAI 2297]